jgi:1,4-dihydroxy-2-naphthoate octaprenyltransferase
VSPYYAYHATVVAVIVGAAAAASRGVLGWSELGLVLAGAAFAHTAAAFFNEYFDYTQRADAHVSHSNPYAGGSRVLFIDGGLHPRQLLLASLVFAAAGAAVGVILAAWRGWPVLLMGMLGYAILVFYTAPPLRLAYRGWGELAVGTAFGPLVVVGSYFVQVQRVDAAPLAASIVLGIFIALVLLFNEFPDHADDVRSGKRNLVVRLTPPRALALCGGLFCAAYILLVLWSLRGPLPMTALLGLVTVPLSAHAFRLLRARFDDPNRLRPANAAMLINHLLLGIALAAAFAIG